MSIVLGACRAAPAPTHPVEDASATIDASDGAAATQTHDEPRVTSPIVAARTAGGIVVAARERAGKRWVVQRFAAQAAASTRPQAESLVDAVVPTNEGQVLAAEQTIALRGDGASVRGRRFVALDANLSAIGEPFAAGDGACATEDGVATIERTADGWVPRFATDAGRAAAIVGPSAGAGAEATLACGTRRVFVVPSGEGARHALAWVPGSDAAIGSSALPPGASDDGTAVATDGDTLVIARIDPAGVVSVVSWSGDGAFAPWSTSKLRVEPNASLESIDANGGIVGLVITRETAAAKGCPAGGDATDTIAEIALVDRASGAVVRAPERIETWRCGADAGPFWVGWAGDRFVAAWPRGADAACSRAGLRWGGVGFAVAERAGGRVRTGRAGRAAEGIAFAGCDDARCWLAAITRGDDACGAGDGARAGTIDLIAVP